MESSNFPQTARKLQIPGVYFTVEPAPGAQKGGDDGTTLDGPHERAPGGYPAPGPARRAAQPMTVVSGPGSPPVARVASLSR